MKWLFLFSLIGLALGASSCDDGSTEPVPSPGGAWALADCPTQSGEAFLFVGLSTIACHHDGRTFVDGLDSLGFFGGGDMYFNSDGDDKLMVLSNFSFERAAYRLHLPSGDVARLSAPGTRGSQINEMAAGRYLITDVMPPAPGIGVVTLTYTAYQSRNRTSLGEVTVDGVGDLVPIRSDYDARSNTIVHSFLSQTLLDYLIIIVDLGTMTKRVVRLEKAFLPSSVQVLSNGSILIFDQKLGKIYRLIDDNFVQIASIDGRYDDETARRLLPYDDSRVVTFSTDGTSTRILTVDAEGTVETLGSVDQPTRYMSTGPDGQSVCGSEFPFYATRTGETYQERVYRRTPAGAVLRQTVTLGRETFVFPFVACF